MSVHRAAQSLLLDNCSFGAPCRREHDPGGEADAQVVLVQAQQVSAVLQGLARLVLQDAATCSHAKDAILIIIQLIENSEYYENIAWFLT